jgi:hypothetical protein
MGKSEGACDGKDEKKISGAEKHDVPFTGGDSALPLLLAEGKKRDVPGLSKECDKEWRRMDVLLRCLTRFPNAQPLGFAVAGGHHHVLHRVL